MPYQNAAGLGVFNQYGPRQTGGAAGVEHTKDSVYQVEYDLTGEFVNTTFRPPLVIPRGAHFLRAILRVDEAFVLGGTSPTVIVGGTAPATNGIVLTQAELQAVGTKIPASTGTGTWAANSATGTTAAERLTVALGGTTPTVSATAGKGTLLLEFVYKTKV